MILASKSPRRIELLKLGGFDFDIIPAVSEETVPNGLMPCEVVLHLANQKATEVSDLYKSDLVIGADTVVALGNVILGKPKDKDDAFRMLKMLSGKLHSVFTGVCIRKGTFTTSFYEKTKVEFYELSDKEIYDYIDTNEPMDKAGAYGIQEKGSLLVKRINGDYFNVVGLPLSRLVRELKSINLSV